MQRRGWIIVGIIVIVLLGIWLLLPHNRSGENKQSKTVTSTALTDYASTDAEVSMTINGPIVAREQYRSVKVTVSRLSRNVTIFKGYEGDVAKSQELGNDQAAFTSFLYALDAAQFTSKKLAPVTATEQGSCPQGQRIVFNIVQDGKQVEHLWTTNCSKTLGTFNGNTALVQSLFKKQIPEYNTYISGVRL